MPVTISLRAWRERRPGKHRNGRRWLPGWSQREAAAWYGCSERQWRRWENGESPIPEHVVRRLAQWTTEEVVQPATGLTPGDRNGTED